MVVTGARGFLGRALLAALDRRGLPFVAVSRLLGPGVLAVADYADSPAARVIVHLAQEPDRAKANALGTCYEEQTEALVRQLCGRCDWLVFASSGVVYGDACDRPFRTSEPVFATDVYSRAKLRNEATVLDAGGCVLRLSNLYGPGMSAANVLSDIATQIPGDGPLLVRDAAPVRDFLFVAEAAEAVAMAVQSGISGILNVGSGQGLSIKAVARLALAAAGELRRPVHSTGPTLLNSVNVLDVEETRRLLGWCPTPAGDRLTHFFRRNSRDD